MGALKNACLRGKTSHQKPVTEGHMMEPSKKDVAKEVGLEERWLCGCGVLLPVTHSYPYLGIDTHGGRRPSEDKDRCN